MQSSESRWQSDSGEGKASLESDSRAVSEIVGVALLVGIVFLGAWLTVVFGSEMVQDVQGENEKQSAELVVQEIDSRMGTLARINDVPRITFTLGSTNPGQSSLVRRGHINVTVNRNYSASGVDCQSELPLSSIRYEDDDGAIVAYEAGGVWRQSRDNVSSAMTTAPDLTFRNGSIDVTVVNMTGRLEDPRNEAELNINTSQQQSTELTNRVLSGRCIRPDNVTIKIQSDFYRAWGEYLESEFRADSTDTTVQVFESNRTAMVFVPQNELPRTTDDSRNQVVNLSVSPTADYMDNVNINNAGANISIDKNAGNIYRVGVRPLNDERLDIGNISENEDTVSIRRDGIDVMLIMDESGSMSNGGSPDKLDQAQASAQSFLGDLNSSKDRAGIVGYDGGVHRHPTDNGRYLSSNFGASGPSPTGVNESINDTNHGGSTRMDKGMRLGRQWLNLNSNESRDQIAILLTDGNNNPSSADTETRLEAEAMDNSSITLYTIGFGGGADNQLLEEIADRTGGENYTADSADELDEVFEDIAKSITTQRQISRLPITTNFTAEDGVVNTPYIAGDTDEVASTTIAGTEFTNINDPNAPSQFRQTFTLEGGEAVEINASWFGCDQYQGTPFSRSHNGKTFQISRCADINDTKINHLDDDNVTIYTDGANMSDPPRSNHGGVLTNESAWWQENMTNTLEPYMDSNQNLTLDSNQAIVIFDYPDGDKSNNRMATLYEIGLSESEAQADGVINLRIRNVMVSEEG